MSIQVRLLFMTDMVDCQRDVQEQPNYQSPHAEFHSVTSGSRGMKKAWGTISLIMVLKWTPLSKDLNLLWHNAFFHPRKCPEMVQTWPDGKVKPYFFGIYRNSTIIQCYALAQDIITTLSKDANFLELSQTTASALQISVHIPSLGYLIRYWKVSLECEF